MDRTIVHTDLDAFFVSCERLKDSRLNNIPLIIGSKSERGVVSSCSYEARYFGVHAAMPMRYALKLCPQAKVISGDMEFYSDKSNEVTEIINQNAPIVEKVSIDEFYLDITGMDRYFGSYKWTSELMDKVVMESGLGLSFGMSENKTISKIATGEFKPMGKIHIEHNMVKGFLNPLSIQKIPMIGHKTYRELSRIGIRVIEQLSNTPPEFLQQLLGKNGNSIWKKANGIDNAPVVAYNEKKSISNEQTFSKDSSHISSLKALLIKMVEKTAYELRKSSQLCSIVSVKIRYANFDTETKQMKIYYTANDAELIPVVKRLFDLLYQRRMLIRLIGVKCSGLVNGKEQIHLFNDTAERINLIKAIDQMKQRFGENIITRAETINAYKG
jgi:DNA polymerase-4|tara:strand:+ start:3241 stop:4395 length:1155 start_codon:yes stop_codon:yes gene_type:complete